MPSLETDITPPSPYSFDSALAFLRASPSAVLETAEGEVYSRAWFYEGRPFLITVGSIGEVCAPRLRVRVAGEAVSQAALAAAVRQVSHIFSLGVEAAPFFALLQTDRLLARLVGEQRAVRPVLVADPFEALVWAIIGQQVGVGFARSLRLAFLKVCNQHMVWEGQVFPLMPAPSIVLGVNEDELRRAHFSRAKIRYLKAAADAVGSGLDFSVLAALDPAEAMAKLILIPGVGPWTAESVLMRGLGVLAVWPAADLGLRRALAQASGCDMPLTEHEARAVAAPWAGWEAWAAFFAWDFLRRRRRETLFR